MSLLIMGWINSGVGTVVDAASGLDQTGVDTGAEDRGPLAHGRSRRDSEAAKLALRTGAGEDGARFPIVEAGW